MNSISWRDGYKYPRLLHVIRELGNQSNRLCREYGLSVPDNSAWKRVNYAAYIAEKNGKPTIRGLIRQDIDRAVSASLTRSEFISNLEKMGYTVKLHGDRGKKYSYPSLHPPGAELSFRFHKLGRDYTLEKINERILDNRRRTLPFPEAEKKELRQYRERTEPRPKVSGIQALYIRYCYELHILEKYPASVKRVPFSVREDLVHLDKLNMQTVFMADNRIETIEDLAGFRAEMEEKKSLFREERRELKNEYQRMKRAGNTERIGEIRQREAEITAEMKTVIKNLWLCDGIEERSMTMEEDMKKLMGERNYEERTVTKEDEQLLRRRGRSGREDDPGRS